MLTPTEQAQVWFTAAQGLEDQLAEMHRSNVRRAVVIVAESLVIFYFVITRWA